MVDHSVFWTVVGTSAPVIALAGILAGDRANNEASKSRRKQRSHPRRLYRPKLFLFACATTLIWLIVVAQGLLFLAALNFLFYGPNQVPKWLPYWLIFIDAACLVYFPIPGLIFFFAKRLREPEEKPVTTKASDDGASDVCPYPERPVGLATRAAALAGVIVLIYRSTRRR